MTENNPAVERYLTRFAEALASVPEAARGEMVREIRSHVGEALHAGRDAADVLEKLGPAERLAAAYRAELLLNRPQGARGIAQRLGLMGALAGVSFVSLIVITILASLALSFIVSGAAVLVTGMGLPLVPEEFISTPFTIPETQIIMIVIGAICAAVGVGAAAGLWAYVRFASRATQELLAKIRMRAAGTAA
ncbi:MAG TPA: DUF1700 domain-containing protein [Candidatus Acidoferrales bacterium]